MDSQKKNERTGMVASIAVHVLILLLMIFVAFKPIDDEELEEETGGVEVSLGEPDQGGPDNLPASAQEQQQAQPDQPVVEEQMLTQDEDAPEIQETPQPTTNQNRQPVSEPVEETQPERQPDSRSMFNPDNSSRGRGDGRERGNEGQPDGSENGDPDGMGQGNSGTGYALSGRKPLYREKPPNTRNKQGTVVVYITVDASGKVTKVQAGARGTTATDKELWRLSEAAAKKWKFDRKKSGNTDQYGTITFVYKY